MNKITSTLAGLALVAAASVAPAFAQGSFTTSSPFSFSFSPAGSFTVSDIPVTYNPLGGGASSTGFLSLSGGTPGPIVFTNTNLAFTSGAFMINDVIPFTTIVDLGNGTYQLSGSPSAMGDSFVLTNGAPVPEASTVVSFGALLALGGLAVLRRKSVKNAA